MSSGEDSSGCLFEGSPDNSGDPDLRRSNRKRRKVNYANSGAAKYGRGRMKDKDQRHPRGFVPRGAELLRSPQLGNIGSQTPEQAVMDESPSSTNTESTGP
jgi:hypothetical protein